MNRLPAGRLLAAPIVLLLAALFAGSARAADEDDRLGETIRTDSVWVVGMTGDSIWVDSLAGDSIRQAVIEDSLSKIPTVAVEAVPPGFHPVYNVQGSFIRATTNITHTFNLDYAFRQNLIAKTKQTVEKRRADRANRESGVRTTNAELQYLIRPGLRIGMRYGRDDNTEQDQLRSTNIVLNRLVLESTFIQDLPAALRFTLLLQGGIENRDKDDDTKATGGSPAISRWEEKRGRATTSTVGLQFSPMPTLGAEVQAVFSRNDFSIETGADSGTTGRNEDNRDKTDTYTGRLRFDQYEFAKMQVNFTVEEAERSFVRAAGGIETATDRRRSAALNMKGKISDRSDYEAKLDYSWGSRDFSVDANQSNERVDYGSEVAFLYKLPVQVKSKLALKRDVSEDTYFPAPGDPDASGRTDRGSIFLTLQRSIWKHTELRGSGSLGMTARVLADTTQDRDNQDKRLAFDLAYAPPGKIKGTAAFSVDEGRTVNIDASRSGNNETRQTWRVSPAIEYAPLPNLKMSSAYTMTLIYIYKEANSDRNTMTRITELRSLIDWMITGAATFGLEYRYKLDESGAFRKEGGSHTFARDRQGETQNFNLRVAYRIGKGLSLETGQYLQVDKQFTLGDKKELDSERKKAQFYSQLLFRRELTARTSINVKARQIQDATVPIFPATATGEDRKIEWELNGGFTFKL